MTIRTLCMYEVDCCYMDTSVLCFRKAFLYLVRLQLCINRAQTKPLTTIYKERPLVSSKKHTRQAVKKVRFIGGRSMCQNKTKQKTYQQSGRLFP